ncbi:MAG: PQQ-like beta-propeller repeat protein, partial [Planctomycetaceae bacterium]|nr:PQQ-like beta-propeller repeat protein [Planctomycetaceae bacterium]
MKTTTLFAVLFLLFGLTLYAADNDWTVFHGPKGDNIAPDTGLLKKWGDSGLKLLWRTEKLGNTEFPGYSGVTIADVKIYITGNVKQNDDDKNANSFVYALDEKTGKEIWQYNNGVGYTGHYPGDRSTPTFDNGKVYALSAPGSLVCLDAKTGKEIWKHNLVEKYDAKLPRWAYAESPIVDGNKLICFPGGKKAAAVAFDKTTGKEIWTTPGSETVGGYATTLVFVHDGKRIYANMNQTGLIGVDAETGAQLFYYEHKTQYDVNATMPYYKDGKILISSGYGSGTELLQMGKENGKITLTQIWKEPKLDNQHGGLIILDGYIYGSAHHYKRGVWMCLKWEDGSIAWEERGVGQGSVSFADGMLYCLGESEEGNLALVKPTPEKYAEISRFNLPEEGAGKFWAHPVINRGKLYIRHAGFLYCYSLTGCCIAW